MQPMPIQECERAVTVTIRIDGGRAVSCDVSADDCSLTVHRFCVRYVYAALRNLIPTLEARGPGYEPETLARPEPEQKRVYQLRAVPDDIWEAITARCQAENHSRRTIVLKALRAYLGLPL